MPTGYWIARITVTDTERYSAYAQALPALIERFGGRFLVAGGRSEAAEGEVRPRNVVIAFDDYETARACWHSPEYAEVARLREGAASVDAVIVEGVDQQRGWDGQAASESEQAPQDEAPDPLSGSF